MNDHKRTQKLLAAYLSHELSHDEYVRVEKHLSMCVACTAEARHLALTVETIARSVGDISDHRPETYWNSFADRLDARLQKEETSRRSLATVVSEFFDSLWVTPGQYVGALGGAVAMLLVVIGIWRYLSPVPERRAVERIAQQPSVVDVSDQRASQYFRRSKALLVGLHNMKVEESDNIDLSDEQKVSRELLHEARFLKQQPLDFRSVRLIDDMDRVFIELANSAHGKTTPDIELIRAGIDRQNLLFKIRMAETYYDQLYAAAGQNQNTGGK